MYHTDNRNELFVKNLRRPSPGSLEEFTRDSEVSFDSKVRPFAVSKLVGPFAVSWRSIPGIYCDCHDLSSSQRRFRLHYLVGECMETFSDLPQDEALKHIRAWQDQIQMFNSRMAALPKQHDMAKAIMSLVEADRIPRAHTAVFSVADRGFVRLLKRLGATADEDCKAELLLPWDKLVRFAEQDILAREWIAAEREAPLPPREPKIDPWLINVSDLAPAAVFAAFYNNAPSPGASAGAAVGHAFIDAWEQRLFDEEGPNLTDIAEEHTRELSVALARKILESEQSWNFDYYKGRRLKLNLGSPSGKVTTIYGQSFDQCAFDGASRFLVERLRSSGNVSRCLKYTESRKGGCSATIT